MKCDLCDEEIAGYSEEFNRLVIDERHEHDICAGCIDKFVKWQGKKLAALFPTRAMKRRYGTAP